MTTAGGQERSDRERGRWRTTPAALDRITRELPDHDAVVAGGPQARTLTFSELRSEVRRALIEPSELLQDTRADEAFVFLANARPLRCGRAIFFRRPEMVARLAENRFRAASPARPAPT